MLLKHTQTCTHTPHTRTRMNIWIANMYRYT